MLDTGDSGYLFDLTQYYGIYFGRDADDEGLALSEMKRWLALLK